MTWTLDGPQGNEAAKIKYEIVRYSRGRGLDIGCGPWKAFPHFIGIDIGSWNGQHADIVATGETLDIFRDESMDFVFSSHLLEHILHPEMALMEWWRVIRPGGHLILYLPHKNFYPNCGQKGSNPDHKHDFLPGDIIGFMEKRGGWDLLRNDVRSLGNEYSFFQVFTKRSDNKHIYSYKNSKPKKRAAVIRYGGIGDMIQASSIFPGLKAQGYHITVYTTPNGANIIKDDPHVNEFFLQDYEQVPNHELVSFWNEQRKHYDKWVNLCESVEGTLLTIPGRVLHDWPHEVRRRLLDYDYLAITHDLAGVPLPPRGAFYPTNDEKKWSLKQKQEIGGPFILWALSGSAVHKAWPYLDQIIARIMLCMPQWRVILVGDPASKILEAGWENEKRVWCRSGVWSVRESLVMAQQADIVIGPETGILNAVGLMQTPKIITMSHSSVNNLCRHWRNVIALEPTSTRCYPCHQMHYGFEYCVRDEQTGTAMCQANISAEQMWTAIQKHLRINIGG